MSERRSFLQELFGLLGPSAVKPVNPLLPVGRGVASRPARPMPVVIHRPLWGTGRTKVDRGFSALWQERHWQRRTKGYSGYYRTRFGAYEGLINERYRGSLEFFIKNPPDCLRRHSHAACFWPKGGGLVYVHFARPARTPDEGIMAIEQIITQAHQLEAEASRHRR